MPRPTGSLLALALTATSCLGTGVHGDPPDRGRIEADVLAALHAFEAAERTLDPDRLIPFLDPEFSMLQDGRRVSYEETVRQMRTTLPALRAFEPSFTDVEVVVLARTAAVTSMRFDDVITAASGEVTAMWGPSTLVWRLRDGVWRILFADSDHYPAPSPDGKTTTDSGARSS